MSESEWIDFNGTLFGHDNNFYLNILTLASYEDAYLVEFEDGSKMTFGYVNHDCGVCNCCHITDTHAVVVRYKKLN